MVENKYIKELYYYNRMLIVINYKIVNILYLERNYNII